MTVLEDRPQPLPCGHPSDDRNLYIDRRGGYVCRTCAREKRKAAGK